MNIWSYKNKIAVFLVCTGLSLPAISGPNLYRYKDQNNQTVIGLTIPPKFVSKGYEVLNNQGRIISKVAPALTKEQIQTRNRLNKENRLHEVAAKEQEQKDKELLRLYSHPDDAVRILSRKVQDIKDVIALKKGNIFSHQNQKNRLEKDAANLERAGKKIPDDVLKNIENEQSKIDVLTSEIENQNLEMKKTFQLFESKITRLELLTGRKAHDYKHLKFEQAQSNE